MFVWPVTRSHNLPNNLDEAEKCICRKLSPLWLSLNAVLSTLPDNPGDPRFWTVSPSLQIRVWNLPNNHQSLPFLVDTTLWQWNFKYFALFELFYLEHFLINSGMPLKYKQLLDWWQVNQSGQMLQFQLHLFCAFLEKWRHGLCIMTSSTISQYLKT